MASEPLHTYQAIYAGVDANNRTRESQILPEDLEIVGLQDGASKGFLDCTPLGGPSPVRGLSDLPIFNAVCGATEQDGPIEFNQSMMELVDYA